MVQIYTVDSDQIMRLLFHLASMELELANQSHSAHLALKAWLCPGVTLLGGSEVPTEKPPSVVSSL